jgi:hypothetical protein
MTQGFLTPEQLAALQAQQAPPAQLNQPTIGALVAQRMQPQQVPALDPAAAQSAFVHAAEQQAAPAPTAPDPTIGQLVSQKLHNVNEIARYATNAPGAGIVDAGRSIADRVARGMGLTPIDTRNGIPPERRDITGFQRDRPTELTPMITPLAEVQAAPTLAQTAPQYRMSAGMGIGGGIGSGSSLTGQIEAGRQGQLAAIGREGDAQSREGVGAADRIDRTSEMDQEDALKAQKAWADKAAMDQEINAGVDEHFRTTDRMVNEIATAKVDSKRLFKDMGAAEAITLGIGAVLGGMMAGLQGSGENKFMDHIDRLVDRDVNDQRSAIESKRVAVNARQNMYGQLLQQTGDRRLADMQLRNLQLEAIKQETKAKADALKTPEILAQSDKIRAAIDLKQEALRTGMLEHKQAQLQAAAAAAANARAAAEKAAWDRQMQLAELGIKQDQLAVEKQKALGTTAKDINAQTQALGKELAEKDLAQGRSSVDAAKRELAKAGPDEGLPGVGVLGDFRADLKPSGINSLNVGAHLLNKIVGLSDQERINRQNWDSIKLQYQQQITGSGASETEREMLSKAFEGARTAAEQRNAIDKADSFFRQREQRITAGYDPAAVAAYRQRLAAEAMPASVKVKK